MRISLVAAAIALLLTEGLAAAHDHWLEVNPWVADKPSKDPPKVYQVMGKYFGGVEPMPLRRRSEALRFELIGPKKTIDLAKSLREDSNVLASLDGATDAGTYLVVMDTMANEIELSGDLFNAYLAEERLIDILQLRADRGDEDAAGKERYTRYLKTVFQQGAPTDAVVTKPVGQELEIVPLANPYRVTPGKDATLEFQILFHGKPLAHRAVTAHNRYRGMVSRQTVRTDKDGKVTFKIKNTGAWIVKLVHMEVSTEKDVDWRSWWATFTWAYDSKPMM
jgi:uncharacterized GH25 family protein